MGSYVRSWDIEGAVRGSPAWMYRKADGVDHFLPHLGPLKQVFNFSIESQVLLHAPLSFEPTYGPLDTQSPPGIDEALLKASEGDEGAEEQAKAVLDEQADHAYLIGEEEMKIFVNSERWSLGELA